MHLYVTSLSLSSFNYNCFLNNKNFSPDFDIEKLTAGFSPTIISPPGNIINLLLVFSYLWNNHVLYFANKDFNIISLYLLGSASKKQLKANSDIDIAFLSFSDIDEYTCFIKAQELAKIFKRDVDLIDLKKASTVFKAQLL